MGGTVTLWWRVRPGEQTPRMAVHVRRATLDDLDALIAMRVEVAREGIWIGAELPLDEAGDRAKQAATIADGETAVLFVATIDEDANLVGSLFIGGPVGVADVGMNVRDGFRGQGIGAALMEAGIDWARDHGMHKVTLQHWPWNERAHALYERFGFVEEGYLRRQWRRKDGSLWDAVMMGLVLDHESPGHDIRQAEPPR